MSAPNAGRQSPDPERQTGAQQGDHPSQPGSGKVRMCLSLCFDHHLNIDLFILLVTRTRNHDDPALTLRTGRQFRRQERRQG